VGGSSVGGHLSTSLKNESRFLLLYPEFLDPPKVSHQGVIKIIKAYFHSGKIWVIIFHKFGQFILAREHLFKVLSWNAVTFFLVLILLVPESYPLCFSASASAL